jgi:hypothetical protein
LAAHLKKKVEKRHFPRVDFGWIFCEMSWGSYRQNATKTWLLWKMPRLSVIHVIFYWPMIYYNKLLICLNKLFICYSISLITSVLLTNR